MYCTVGEVRTRDSPTHSFESVQPNQLSRSVGSPYYYSPAFITRRISFGSIKDVQFVLADAPQAKNSNVSFLINIYIMTEARSYMGSNRFCFICSCTYWQCAAYPPGLICTSHHKKIYLIYSWLRITSTTVEHYFDIWLHSCLYF